MDDSGEIERHFVVQDLLTEALNAAWQSILERELCRQVQQCVIEQCLAASMAAIEMAHVNREPEPADPATTSSWQPNQQPAPCLPDTWMRGVVQVRQLLPERTGTGKPCSSCVQVNVLCPVWSAALLLLTCVPACGLLTCLSGPAENVLSKSPTRLGGRGGTLRSQGSKLLSQDSTASSSASSRTGAGRQESAGSRRQSSSGGHATGQTVAAVVSLCEPQNLSSWLVLPERELQSHDACESSWHKAALSILQCSAETSGLPCRCQRRTCPEHSSHHAWEGAQQSGRGKATDQEGVHAGGGGQASRGD